jgi:hypothetical protein
VERSLPSCSSSAVLALRDRAALHGQLVVHSDGRVRRILRAGSLKVGQSIMPNCCWGIGRWARPHHQPLISGRVGARKV